MKRKVVFARLHESIHIPLKGETGKTLPPSGAKESAFRDVKMEYDEAGLHLLYGKKDILIPYPSVAIVELVVEEESSK